MNKYEIKLSDWTRIFAGNVPPSFYLEIIIRAFLIYFLLMFSMRLLGKRMSAQMSRLDLCAMVAMASAIGVPMLSPDRGILPAFIIAFVVVGINKLIAKKSFTNEHFEYTTQGSVFLCVDEGVMCYDTLKKIQITRERLFAQLRSECVNHLGEVKRVYQESNGTFTIIKEENPRPGLLLLPSWDKSFVDSRVHPTDVVICKNCGLEAPAKEKNSDTRSPCSNCGDNDWVQAVVNREQTNKREGTQKTDNTIKPKLSVSNQER